VAGALSRRCPVDTAGYSRLGQLVWQGRGQAGGPGQPGRQPGGVDELFTEARDGSKIVVRWMGLSNFCQSGRPVSYGSVEG
jgi:hypothetical protein